MRGEENYGPRQCLEDSTFGNCRAKADEDHHHEQPLYLLGKVVELLVVAVPALGGAQSDCGDKDCEKAVAMGKFGHAVGEAGDADGDEAVLGL